MHSLSFVVRNITYKGVKVKAQTVTNVTILGARIQAARESKGMTREDLCALAKVSQNWLYKMEHGLYLSPSLPHLERVCSILEVDTDTLVGLAREGGSGDVSIRFSVPDGVRLTLEDIESAKPIMQQVLNEIAKQRRKATGSGGGDVSEKNS